MGTMQYVKGNIEKKKNTMSELYTTQVEILESEQYSIIAECEVTCNVLDYAEEHPFGESTATERYSEVEVEDVEILSWYRDFDCDEAMEFWIPEHLNVQEGSDGLSQETKKKIIRNAKCNIESELL